MFFMFNHLCFRHLFLGNMKPPQKKELVGENYVTEMSWAETYGFGAQNAQHNK